MDRRKRKSREAIFKAFIQLLSKKKAEQITVGEIIELADVGRATFYAHFETKDYLLKELCEELFCHIFDATDITENHHKHIFECDTNDFMFLHLFKHLQKNDNNILTLITCQDNELFLSYFKNGLISLIKNEKKLLTEKTDNIPEDFRINHIASTFIETVRWWVKSGMTETPEKITEYFCLVLNI